MKIFISYADQDATTAKQLASELREAGHEVWNPERDILPGDNYRIAEDQAREAAEAMVVLLSDAALKTTRVRQDINFALGSVKFCDRLIPIQIGPVDEHELPWILRKIGVLRFVKKRGRNVESIIERLESAPV